MANIQYSMPIMIGIIQTYFSYMIQIKTDEIGLYIHKKKIWNMAAINPVSEGMKSMDVSYPSPNGFEKRFSLWTALKMKMPNKSESSSSVHSFYCCPSFKLRSFGWFWGRYRTCTQVEALLVFITMAGKVAGTPIGFWCTSKHLLEVAGGMPKHVLAYALQCNVLFDVNVC